MAMLVTLSKYQEAVGTSANPTKQTEAIEDASAAILNWTDRDFSAADVVATRTWKYDGSGILDIDDCHTITAVTFQGTALAAGRYIARKEGPESVPVYSYLELPPFTTPSGQMGFTYNLDVFLSQFPVREIDVSVTATFGWPTVPDDVQRATIWTAAAFEADPSSVTGQLQSKSVAEVSESYAQAAAITAQVADEEPIPPRARALLWPYRRGSFR